MQLELRIPPLALWAGCAVAIAAAARWLTHGNVPFPGHRTFALASVLLGWLVTVAGVVEFRRRKTTVNPLTPSRASSLVDTGVYRRTRNPMYLGMALVLLGIALWWSSVPGLAVVLAFCVYIDRFQIRPEERALRGLFGDEFSSYASRVRRWL